MTRALTRLNPYWTLVGAMAYTIAVGLVYGYVSASEASSALVVYLGAAVLMAPAIAISLIARQGERRRTRRVADVADESEFEQVAAELLRDEKLLREVEIAAGGGGHRSSAEVERIGHVVAEIAAELALSAQRMAQFRVDSLRRLGDRISTQPAADEAERERALLWRERDAEQRERQIDVLETNIAELLVRLGRTPEQIADALDMTVADADRLYVGARRRLAEHRLGRADDLTPAAPPTPPPRRASSVMVGESLVGEGNEVAHIDLLIGPKDGPVGRAFAAALVNQKQGHTNLLAVVAPNLPAKPDTIIANKVTIKGATQAVQMFGPAQAAVARAVVDSVRDGVIPSDQVDNLCVVAGVFIHWEATDDKKIFDWNYEATKQSIARAIGREPSVQQVLDGEADARRAFAAEAEA